MENHQIKFVSITAGIIRTESYDCRIELSPEVRYRLEHENPLDPIDIDKVDRYHEDEVKLVLILTAAEYNELYDLLEDADNLYIEFMLGEYVRQYNVSDYSQPSRKDIGRIYKDESEMNIISRYRGSLPASIDSYTYFLTNTIWI